MKINKIHIHSFKSIIDTIIEVKHDCIGIVGINESGKSNLLQAISKLNKDNPLTEKDKPKMKDDYAYISYRFKLDNNEMEIFTNKVREYYKEKSLGSEPTFEKNIHITSHVKFSEKETRWYNIEGVKPNKGDFFPKNNFGLKDYEVIYEGTTFKLENIDIINSSLLNRENKNLELNLKAYKIKKEIIKIEDEISKLASHNKKDKLEDLKEKKESIQNQLTGIVPKITFDLKNHVEDINSKIQNSKTTLAKYNSEKTSFLDRQKKLNGISVKNINHNRELIGLEKNISTKKNQIDLEKKTIEELEKKLENIEKTIFSHYTNDFKVFETNLISYIENTINNFIPQSVLWENLPEYILPSNIKFSDIISSKNEDGVSRPLLNLFRIGMEIKDLDELKNKLKSIKDDGSKRSSYQLKINSKVNKYISEVWSDFNQELKISLEENQIRIEIYDPNRSEDADFYELHERSQGCKAFLSFLLTIGVEAKKGIFKNKVLLLDEPENHLHPSGQRNFLSELLKISLKNFVVYATHSNHMINKDDYEQHLIITKNKDKTIITECKKDRVGNFLQEEVLYNALDIDLSKEIGSIEDFNFVLEGYGDVVLFQNYYTYVLDSSTRPFILKKSSFFQGGKCSDIIKVFTKRPIQLGQKWIFIIDSDEPANNLKNFLKRKYKNYVDKDIFIFQYPGELEDLLPNKIIIDSYMDTFKNFGINYTEVELSKIIKEKKYFVYSDIIKESLEADIDSNEFQSKFKGYLNDNIKNHSSTIKEPLIFSETFEKYNDFVKDVIEKLRNPLT